MEKRKSAMDIFQEQQANIPVDEEIEDVINDFDEETESECQEYDEPVVQMNMAPISVKQELSQNDINGPLSGVSNKSSKIMRRVKKKKSGSNKIVMSMLKSSEDLQLEKEPIKVRETGRWFWRRIIVPPNAYVIHTRIGRKKPVTVGMGVSFKYNPNTDAFMIVPAVMQTIGVVANCISKEKQGINILAYVQWQIDDFLVAYKKLDLSDSRDPLAIVNAQLREQAEAAIKDKIATMSVEEVLTDKEPVIEELTLRLKLVAERQIKDEKVIREGLGIKIITVQIREAFVCSSSLWEDLQSPFRFEQKKQADISYLDMQNDIKRKELETHKELETNEAETNLAIEQLTQKNQTEAFKVRDQEEQKRFVGEQDSMQKRRKLEEETEIKRKDMENRLHERDRELTLKQTLAQMKNEEIRVKEEERLTLDTQRRQVTSEIEQQIFQSSEETRMSEELHELRTHQIELENSLSAKEAEFNQALQKQETILQQMQQLTRLEQEERQKSHDVSIQQKQHELDIKFQTEMARIEKLRQEAHNLVSSNVIISQLVKELPGIAAQMPKIDELKVFASGSQDPMLDSLVMFVQKIFALAESVGITLPGGNKTSSE